MGSFAGKGKYPLPELIPEARTVVPQLREPAAQYVRMSTEHQRYSTENQAKVIAKYAQERGFEIVRTYADEGKSGLMLANRDGLQRLISDVQSGAAAYEAVLVFDVSRWGRFQNADESAYYEYTCIRAGISVHYCAEPFENDGSPLSTIMKGVKRAMAGEYSRELSAKVFLGQSRLAELGWRMGGTCGYGLRRMLVDDKGSPKGELLPGQRKNISTDRVVLIPGPPNEVRTVRWIYRRFVEGGQSIRRIQRELNARGIPGELGRRWTWQSVRQVLRNEKYAGATVWNRTSIKLRGPRVINPRDQWIRSNVTFPALVERQLFETAQVVSHQHQGGGWSDEVLLKWLRKLLDKHGKITAQLINATKNMPSSSTYKNRFGTLYRAYELVGYAPKKDYSFAGINRKLAAERAPIIRKIVAGIQAIGGTIESVPDSAALLINGEFTIHVMIMRCRFSRIGTTLWKLRLNFENPSNITVAARMDRENQRITDYFLVPSEQAPRQHLTFRQKNRPEVDAWKSATLDPLFAKASRLVPPP